MYYNPLKKKKIDVVVPRASSYSLLASLLLSLNKKIKIMTYKEANNISIKDYLNSLGIQPVTEKGSYGMYRSPLREDNTPSFKVDYNANLWCDYGTGEGGTLIDLVMKQNGCNAYGAICRLEQDDTASFSFHGKDLPERDTKRQAASPIEIRRIQPLQNPALIRYLQERGISPGTASPYVQEMYYRIGGKPYFALAFKNDSGGYELRNPRFKGSTSKDITHIRQQGEPRDTCFVFEGFLDFLSFLTIRQQKSPDMPCTDWQDYVILNSTANTDKALYPLADYGHIHCMLDNDEAGRKAVEAIRQEYKWRVRDASHLYSGHNDLNDYLRSLKVKQSQDLTVTDKPQPEQDNRQNPGEKRKRGLRM